MFTKTKRKFSSMPLDQAHEQNNETVKVLVVPSVSLAPFSDGWWQVLSKLGSSIKELFSPHRCPGGTSTLLLALDHTNYARWLPVRITDLKALPLEPRDEFKNHWMFTKTKRKFSSMPLDQAHEQNNETVKVLVVPSVSLAPFSDGWWQVLSKLGSSHHSSSDVVIRLERLMLTLRLTDKSTTPRRTQVNHNPFFHLPTSRFLMTQLQCSYVFTFSKSEQQSPPVYSISTESVDVSPPPVYTTTHTDIVVAVPPPYSDTTDAEPPPSYNSQFGRMQAARKKLSDMCDFFKNSKAMIFQSLAANRVECFGEINKCCEEMAVLFLALLWLSCCTNHVDGASSFSQAALALRQKSLFTVH
ncbi:hypothetical protein NP493_351g02032 [Ridgeia piscesae]|uniref:Uncharacterized protein n=1 Tax=Ridgeia piscesae TaxID=27915 RepID=A0AAD9L359_RIDPI|nr:hypothetical protein NP493_351g02032 [Ridgeia piscesae]